MTSIFEGQPPKTRPFPNKTKGHLGSRCVLYIYIYIYTHIDIFSKQYCRHHPWHIPTRHPKTLSLSSMIATADWKAWKNHGGKTTEKLKSKRLPSLKPMWHLEMDGWTNCLPDVLSQATNMTSGNSANVSFLGWWVPRDPNQKVIRYQPNDRRLASPGIRCWSVFVHFLPMINSIPKNHGISSHW